MVSAAIFAAMSPLTGVQVDSPAEFSETTCGACAASRLSSLRTSSLRGRPVEVESNADLTKRRSVKICSIGKVPSVPWPAFLAHFKVNTESSKKSMSVPPGPAPITTVLARSKSKVSPIHGIADRVLRAIEQG